MPQGPVVCSQFTTQVFRCIPPRSGCGKGQTVFVSWSCVHHGALRGPSVERDIDAQFLSRAFTVNVGNTRCRRSSFMMTRMLSGGASDAIPVSRCCSSPARRSLDGSPPVPLRPCVWRKVCSSVLVSLSYVHARKFSATFPNPQTLRFERNVLRNTDILQLDTCLLDHRHLSLPHLGFSFVRRPSNLGHVSASGPGLATFYKITVYFSRTRLETLN
ncbi:hypothetical protein EDD17DRAFT_171121 [Pisolithus thermaeus]|nr:hypothetical protein EDD17DRAFT_171121 [Pisolithus thermaeus]